MAVERDRERDRKIFELRESGVLWREIGKRFGISANRAWQLYEREKFTRNKEQAI